MMLSDWGARDNSVGIAVASGECPPTAADCASISREARMSGMDGTMKDDGSSIARNDSDVVAIYEGTGSAVKEGHLTRDDIDRCNPRASLAGDSEAGMTVMIAAGTDVTFVPHFGADGWAAGSTTVGGLGTSLPRGLSPLRSEKAGGARKRDDLDGGQCSRSVVSYPDNDSQTNDSELAALLLDFSTGRVPGVRLDLSTGSTVLG
jgi:hypothetical protein